MRRWAIGTSPHGLGLSSEAFWALSPREFEALREVYDEPRIQWGIQCAMYANVHFRAPGTAPFKEDDFLGTGDRAQRNWEAIVAAREVAKLNAELAAMKPGETANLPEWAVN